MFENALGIVSISSRMHQWEIKLDLMVEPDEEEEIFIRVAVKILILDGILWKWSIEDFLASKNLVRIIIRTMEKGLPQGHRWGSTRV